MKDLERLVRMFLHLVLAAIIALVLGIEVLFPLSKIGTALLYQELRSPVRFCRLVRVGMMESDVRLRLGPPKSVCLKLSRAVTNGYYPAPETPVRGKVLLYQTESSLLIDSVRLYVYVGRDGRVRSLVLAED